MASCDAWHGVVFVDVDASPDCCCCWLLGQDWISSVAEAELEVLLDIVAVAVEVAIF